MVIYKPGDVICECLPFVHVVDEAEKGKRCDYCLEGVEKLIKLMKCARCQQMHYCSRECQVADWKCAHKFKECELFAKLSSENFYANNQILRSNVGENKILFRYVLKNRLDTSVHGKNYELFNGRIRTINDLMDHIDTQKKDKEVTSLCKLVQDCLQKIELNVSIDEIRHLYGQLAVNSFGIRSAMRPVSFATGLYIEASIFDHSCEPSACRLFEGNRIQVRALRTIDTAKEQPTVTYIDVMEPRAERTKSLKDIWHFDCNCSKCTTRSDAKFNYVLYQELLQTNGSVNDFKLRLRNFQQLSEFEQMMCGAYNPLTTENLSNMFFTLVKKVPKSPKQQTIWAREVKALERKFDEALLVTHGQEHSFYQKVNLLKKDIYHEVLTAYQLNLNTN